MPPYSSLLLSGVITYCLLGQIQTVLPFMLLQLLDTAVVQQQ